MVYANCYVYGYMVVDGDEILEQGRYIDDNGRSDRTINERYKGLV